MANKFGAVRTEYKGDIYDSKAEADFARDLDISKKAVNEADRVISWERQVCYKVIIGGKYICSYYLDFRVLYANRVQRSYDVKGYKKGSAYALFRLKKKLVQATHHIVIDEVE